MRISSLLFAPALLTLVACDKGDTAPPVPLESAPAAPTETDKPKREPAADLDAKQLSEGMKCNSKSKNGCIALASFEGAKSWDLTTIRSDEARYFGKAWIHKGDDVQEAWAFLVVKKLPLNEVKAGDLAAKVALRTMDDAPASALAHTDKLYRILQRDGAVNKLNNAAQHVKSYAPARWDGAAQTKGASTLLFIDAGAYVREGDSRALHVVKLDVARPGAAAGDGTFATLYPLSW